MVGTFAVVAAVSVVLAGGITWAHIKGPRSHRPRFVWAAPAPEITRTENCPISQEHIDEAVEFLEVHGFRFRRSTGRAPYDATARPWFGTIVIEGPRTPNVEETLSIEAADADAAARAAVRVVDGKACYAIICVNPVDLQVDPVRVVVHELLHAMGFGHINMTGHMMHARYAAGGWDMRGIYQ